MQHLEGSGTPVLYTGRTVLNPLNAELNPICHLLALLGAHHILHVSRIRVKDKYTYIDVHILMKLRYEGHKKGESGACCLRAMLCIGARLSGA
jgi:hypothetical protein